MSNLPQDLIGLLREGNATAFQQLFHSCYDSLCRYAFTILRDTEEAEDTVQSMFVKIWEKRETLDIKQDMRSYLFRSVYNQCMNLIEHRTVMRKHNEHVISAVSQSIEPDIFPDELETKIRSVVESLPPQCKTIFMMSRYEELKYPEIAVKLNISVNTIQNQVCKALKILREELKDIIA